MKKGKYSLPAETPRKGKSNVPGKRDASKLDTKRDVGFTVRSLVQLAREKGIEPISDVGHWIDSLPRFEGDDDIDEQLMDLRREDRALEKSTGCQIL